MVTRAFVYPHIVNVFAQAQLIEMQNVSERKAVVTKVRGCICYCVSPTVKRIHQPCVPLS